MIIMDWLRKIADIVMPLEPLPEEEEQTVEKKAEATPAAATVETPVKRAAAGGGASYTQAGTTSYTSYNSETASSERPNLKIVPPSFVMKVYQPSDYNNVNGIADDILSHKAAVVNYEFVHEEEQLRICDYIEGVCYAVDGTVTKISEKIFLYAPAGISTSDIAALVASVRYR